MAQSIKLDNDLYWDTSGIHGGHIFNFIGNTSSTMTINVPKSFRGLLLVQFASNSNVGLYSVVSLASGATYVTPIVSSSSVTITRTTNTVTLTVSGSAYVWAIGNQLLTQ